MPTIISHRCNTVDQLLATPTLYGVEVDVRSFNNKLILQHEPFIDGECLSNWIAFYRHNILILNVKEEGLESELINLMRLHQIENFFFLDQSFPFLIKWSALSQRRSAVRLSEYESIETVLNLAGMVDWVWVDCFSKFSLSADQAIRLKNAGFNICLVSPELHGRSAEREIPIFISTLLRFNIAVDAICTKRIDLWKSYGAPK